MKYPCVHEIFELCDGTIYGGSIFNLQKAHYYFILAPMHMYQMPLNAHYYPIKNYDVPHHSNFIDVINQACTYIQEGHTIFVGCLSGHGRTGLFLTLLYYHLTQDKNGLYVIRERYCKKAVESVRQLNYLKEHGLFVSSSDIKKATLYGRI